MLISRPIVAQCLRLRWELRALCHSRLLHRFRKGAGSFIRFRPSKPPPSQKPSLLEELFPEDVQRDGNRDPRLHDDVQNVPRLPLPEVDDALGGIGHESDSERAQPKRVAKAAATKVFRHQQIAVLWLDTASKSLIESDFRRIAPKGQHIDDWTGPGDILKSGLRKEKYLHKMLVTNPNYSHSFARPHDVGISRSLLHTIPQSRVRSNLSEPCHSPTSNSQNPYANIY